MSFPLTLGFPALDELPELTVESETASLESAAEPVANQLLGKIDLSRVNLKSTFGFREERPDERQSPRYPTGWTVTGEQRRLLARLRDSEPGQLSSEQIDVVLDLLCLVTGDAVLEGANPRYWASQLARSQQCTTGQLRKLIRVPGGGDGWNLAANDLVGGAVLKHPNVSTDLVAEVIAAALCASHVYTRDRDVGASAKFCLDLAEQHPSGAILVEWYRRAERGPDLITLNRSALADRCRLVGQAGSDACETLQALMEDRDGDRLSFDDAIGLADLAYLTT